MRKSCLAYTLMLGTLGCYRVTGVQQETATFEETDTLEDTDALEDTDMLEDEQPTETSSSATEDNRSLPCEHMEGYEEGAPWPTWQGCPSRAGRSRLIGPKSPHEAWVVSVSDDFLGDPVVGADGAIYLTARDSIVALNADGSMRWQWFYGFSDPRSYRAPVIHRDHVIVVQSDWGGLITALSAAGDLLWQLGGDGFADAHVLIDPAGTIYGTRGSSAYYKPEALLALTVDGDELWRHEELYSLGFNSAALSPDANIIVTTHTNGMVRKLSSTDGMLLWGLDDVLMGLQAPSVSTTGDVYFCAGIGSQDHRLAAVTATGDLNWDLTLDEQCLATPAIGADGTLYLDLETQLLAITPEGMVLWRAVLPVDPGPNSGGPLVDGDGTIYVVRGGLFAYTPDGALLFEAPDENLEGSAALGRNGTLYVTGTDGTLHAFRDEAKN